MKQNEMKPTAMKRVFFEWIAESTIVNSTTTLIGPEKLYQRFGVLFFDHFWYMMHHLVCIQKIEII